MSKHTLSENLDTPSNSVNSELEDENERKLTGKWKLNNRLWKIEIVKEIKFSDDENENEVPLIKR